MSVQLHPHRESCNLHALYSIYPDDKVLIGSNKVTRTEFISQPRDRREKSISGQYISIFSRRLFWQKQSITHIILGPPRQILQIIGSSDISSFEPLQSSWLWLEMTQPSSLIILSMLPCVKIPINAKTCRCMCNVHCACKNAKTHTYRVSHITGPTFFLPFSRLLEHVQRNFS